MMSDIISADWFLARTRAEPLPNLLAQSIREAIRQGKLTPGQRLPGENELSRQLGVSRATLRAAVDMLLAQRVLERRHGVGTFVANSSLMVIEEGLESLVSTTALIRAHGYQPGTVDQCAEQIPCSPQLAKVLNIPPDAAVLHISRTRSADRKPVIQAEEYMPASVLSLASVSSNKTDWSLYELMKESGSRIETAVCRITAVSANRLLSHKLAVPVRYSLLLLTQTHFNEHHEPILFCENYHNSSIIDFQVLRHT